jgi:cytochrome c biogenesis protein CcmG/thiol:disulfide interchange protein DsbE
MINKSVIILLVLSSALLFAFIKNDGIESSSKVLIQDRDSLIKAPDFSLKSTEGKTIKLSDYKGKIVIIDFWTTWCPPCKRGIPDLIDLQNKYKSKLVIIGISVDYEQTIAQVKPFVKNFGINYPVVYADYNVLMSYGGVASYPTTFIVNQDGYVVKGYVGLYPKYIYEEEIKELLAGL